MYHQVTRPIGNGLFVDFCRAHTLNEVDSYNKRTGSSSFAITQKQRTGSWSFAVGPIHQMRSGRYTDGAYLVRKGSINIHTFLNMSPLRSFGAFLE